MPEGGEVNKASLDVQLPLFWPLISESGIIFSVHDLVWPRTIVSFLPPLTDLKNWKIANHLNVGMLLHIKWKLDSSIAMKICPDKWEVFIDLWWPQNLAF